MRVVAGAGRSRTPRGPGAKHTPAACRLPAAPRRNERGDREPEAYGRGSISGSGRARSRCSFQRGPVFRARSSNTSKSFSASLCWARKTNGCLPRMLGVSEQFLAAAHTKRHTLHSFCSIFISLSRLEAGGQGTECFRHNGVLLGQRRLRLK
jgi:hypothetical protein